MAGETIFVFSFPLSILVYRGSFCLFFGVPASAVLKFYKNGEMLTALPGYRGLDACLYITQ